MGFDYVVAAELAPEVEEPPSVSVSVSVANEGKDGAREEASAKAGEEGKVDSDGSEPVGAERDAAR